MLILPRNNNHNNDPHQNHEASYTGADPSCINFIDLRTTKMLITFSKIIFCM